VRNIVCPEVAGIDALGSELDGARILGVWNMRQDEKMVGVERDQGLCPVPGNRRLVRVVQQHVIHGQVGVDLPPCDARAADSAQE
jgi:hypothetical protein